MLNEKTTVFLQKRERTTNTEERRTSEGTEEEFPKKTEEEVQRI